ncbi:hypothetical protein GIB67_007348 [Kingdonia uniflora]|uniref:Thioredoxin domain-containing protein n=1 Tax=Kingdonia uniflora TaxID=39325 RepID=A0A7J7NX99_9MAGN|nr:hypothetical protein GIB67_007348 [Kingdonia uniflora]
MAASIVRSGFCCSSSNEAEILKTRRRGSSSSAALGYVRIAREKRRVFSGLLKSEFKGKQVVLGDQIGFGDWSLRTPTSFSIHAQASICICKGLRWWEKTLKPNMIEISSAQELVDSLLNAGDKLVILDFYSPGCGGCKALHPKLCQLAELHPDAIILKVNFDELKTMCYSLNIHVLPFFRFYRGSEGRVCSFSCTNTTIKKFKDALAKHGTERCSLGPAKGLEESELLKLVSNGEISLNIPSKSINKENADYFATQSPCLNASHL